MGCNSIVFPSVPKFETRCHGVTQNVQTSGRDLVPFRLNGSKQRPGCCAPGDFRCSGKREGNLSKSCHVPPCMVEYEVIPLLNKKFSQVYRDSLWIRRTLIRLPLLQELGIRWMKQCLFIQYQDVTPISQSHYCSDSQLVKEGDALEQFWCPENWKCVGLFTRTLLEKTCFENTLIFDSFLEFSRSFLVYRSFSILSLRAWSPQGWIPLRLRTRGFLSFSVNELHSHLQVANSLCLQLQGEWPSKYIQVPEHGVWFQHSNMEDSCNTMTWHGIIHICWELATIYHKRHVYFWLLVGTKILLFKTEPTRNNT